MGCPGCIFEFTASELEWAPAANDARYSERNKKVSDGREQISGEFCVMHQEHKSSHFHQQKQFWKLFFPGRQCMDQNPQDCSCRFWWVVVLFFLYTRNSETLWSPVSVNILNGANLNIIFCPDLFFKTIVEHFFCRHWNGTGRHLLQDQQIHWPTRATDLKHLQFSVVSLLRHVVVDPLTVSLQDEKLFEKLAQHAETWNYSDLFDFSAASQQLMSLKDW